MKPGNTKTKNISITVNNPYLLDYLITCPHETEILIRHPQIGITNIY